VRDSLKGGPSDIEGATLGMARALAVIKALDQSILKEADRENFEQLRKQVSNRLKDLMVSSVNQKDEHEIERIA
jgi:hypothetical protein